MADTVDVRTLVRFAPFAVPKEAFVEEPPRPRQEGFVASRGVPIEELEPAVLDALAKRWLDNLYAVAGRPSPFMQSEPDNNGRQDR